MFRQISSGLPWPRYYLRVHASNIFAVNALVANWVKHRCFRKTSDAFLAMCVKYLQMIIHVHLIRTYYEQGSVLRWCWSSISSQSDFCMFLHIFSMKVWVRNPRSHPEVSRIDFGTFLNRFRSRCWYPCCIMLETFEWFVLSSLIFRYTFFTCLSSSAAKRSESVLEVVALTEQAITSSDLCVPLDFLLHLLRLLFLLRCSIAPLHWFSFCQFLHIASMIF